MAQGYLIFHLNLAFSSIKTELCPEVIKKCYWPLLELAEATGIPVGIELTGWTLQQIAALDQAWIAKFRQMLEDKQCELIGSGWAQIIGPIVPYEVNCWNQKLGLQAYRQMLGVTPCIALVNEMAFSTGMVDVYTEVGYQGIVMDRDNVRLALGLNHAPLSATPTHAQGCGEQALPVLWSDSILFQRLQRVVHGDITVADYMQHVQTRCKEYDTPLPIYCNDAEIFDFRPGRFTTEGRLHQDGEWKQLRTIFQGLERDLKFGWVSPTEALTQVNRKTPHKLKQLTSISQPIPVKKQAKYNVNRWALTGRDDLWLNSNCHQICQVLAGRKIENGEDWRTLCELWASDLRTHITEERWNAALTQLSEFQSRLEIEKNRDKPVDTQENERITSPDLGDDSDIQITREADGIYWTVKTPQIQLVLNVRRGLAIASIAFRAHGFKSVIGTLHQGYFDSIELGADFYSGGLVIEIPGERTRITDLEWVTPEIERSGNLIRIRATVPLPGFTLVKTIAVDSLAETVVLGYNLDGLDRPLGSVRLGILTLIPDELNYPLAISCKNGGANPELFSLDGDVDHTRSVSPIVSSTTGLGATEGRLFIGDENIALELSWSPADCAAVPMLLNRACNEKYLTRVIFSLAELDDTSKPGGHLASFMVSLKPAAPFKHWTTSIN